MMDLKLTRIGSLLMHDGEIHIGGFDVDEGSCRDVAALAMLWAIGELQRELAALIDRPGGSGRSSIDLPPAVEKALGIPPPWERDWERDIDESDDEQNPPEAHW